MRAIRGAICAEANTRVAIYAATQTLLRTIVERNRLERHELVSVFFTMTPDLDAEYPAYAARDMGWAEIPMLGAVETSVPGALTRVIRVLLLAEGDAAARHVYLGRAAQMRPDLAGPGDETLWNGHAREPHISEPRGSASSGTLLVVGLGLVGGSIAGGARRAGIFGRVAGYDPDREVAARARARGLVDDLPEWTAAAAEADLIVLATPLGALPGWVRDVGRVARAGTVVTDVGSLKRDVVSAMDELPSAIRAVGGHPMAGSERTGVDAADPRLFEGAPWALVPTRRTDDDALARVRALVRALGARPVPVAAEEHDRAVAVTSHLPALVACALALAAGRAAGMRPAVVGLVGPGFRSTTRLAAAPPALSADLLTGNRAHVAEDARELIRALEEILDVARDRHALHELLRRARDERRRLAPEPPEG